MASVHSPVRRLIKPILKKFFGERFYSWMLVFGKIRDIRGRLVEEDEMELLPSFIAPGDQVIDIGANYAYYTTRMAKLCPEGEVYSFEPIPATHRACKRIVKLFGIKNVHLFPYGVGETSGTVEFEVPLQEIGTPSAGQAHMRGRRNDLPGSAEYYPFPDRVSVSCPVVALDDPEWSARFKNVTFVKIDIEGAELFALTGMKNLLREHKPIVQIEICPFFLKGFGIKLETLLSFVASVDYGVYRYEKDRKKLVAENGEFRDGNYILVPKAKTGKYASILE